ncbi:MAG: TonB-dependent receptor [Steroidobacteraceae bacterium]|nr:TonB-dependent receptor [Steroidobacteraceae bacterium]
MLVRKKTPVTIFQKSAIALAVSMSLTAVSYSQEQDATELDEVVVTGFRGSLNTALAAKRAETASIDVISAEDVGKFPDSNLAESMQRIPSVALSRGDGGEGKNISVRGLGPTFTRVRINGMEAASQTGSSDIYGAGNNGRTFDFNVFPTELFSQLAVRKTASADVEEGSLGATVDLQAPRPFDYADSSVFSVTARGIYNDVSEDVDPRASMLFSQKFADDTFGVLAAVAYQRRNIRETGYSAVDILPASASALNIAPMGTPGIWRPFCTPVGYVGQGPVTNAGTGASATNCATGNLRTSDLTAYNTVMSLTNPAILDPVSRLPIPGGGAFFPRLPRYVNSEQDTERTGGTLSFQWQPNENTNVSIDGLKSKYQVERRDNYLLGLSFGRTITALGQPMVSVREIEFDEHGSIQYGLFDGVDVRSEGLVDQFTATFEQVNLNVDHKFSEEFEVNVSFGRSNSIWDGPMRLQTFLDVIDVDGFSIDFRGGRENPIIGFGDLDPANVNSYTYAPGLANGTVLGGFSTQGKPARNVTSIDTKEFSGTWSPTEMFDFTLGIQDRTSNFRARNSNLFSTQAATTVIPAGSTLADFTTTIDGLDESFGSGAPASWVAIDSKKWRELFGFADRDFCGIECAAPQSQIIEEIKTGFLMASFDSGDRWGIPVRGDIGVRYVKTQQFAVGHIPVATGQPAPFNNRGARNEVTRSYTDTLPSLNVVVEFTPDLLMRFGASKVMSRPDLGNLTPSATVTVTTQNATVNNPFLDPIRAKTADLGLEWYFAEGSLLSVAYFYKDIETYIQRVTQRVPYNTLGLPDSLLDVPGSPSGPNDLFNASRLFNTEGGPLKGFEINAQIPFKFIDVPVLNNFGVLANYTRVESEIEYITATTPNDLAPNGFDITGRVTNDLVDLSKNTASATLFYDDGRFGARVTGSYRDKYIRAIPASLPSDVRANKANTFVDFSSSFNVNDNLTLILEVQNVTDERNTLYIDSVREDTLFQTEIGRTATLGATFKF